MVQRQLLAALLLTAAGALGAPAHAQNPQNLEWLNADLGPGGGAPSVTATGALRPFGTVTFDAQADPGDLCVAVFGSDADVPGVAFPNGNLIPTGAGLFVPIPLDAQGKGSRTFTLNDDPPTSIYVQLVCVDPSGQFSFSNTRGANRGHQWTADPTPVSWSSRQGHAAVVHQNRVYLLTGLASQQPLNDVHRFNGSSWTKLLSNDPNTTSRFAGRFQAAVGTHDGRIWVGPGEKPGGYVNDLWSSTNGTTWTLESADLAASGGPGPRRGAQMISFNGRLLVLGGYYKQLGTSPPPLSLYLDEVWAYDSQTQNWSMTHAPWAGREEHMAVVHDGKLFVIGGQSVANNQVPYNFIRFADVWSTSDGVNWKQETANAGFVPMTLHSVASFQGELQLFGGYQNSYNYQWRSKTGANWTVPLELGGPGYNFGNQPIPSAAKDAMPDVTRREAVGLVYDGRLWSVGGYGINPPYNEVVVSH